MTRLASTINIRVDARDKEEATNILNDLGLNMNTYFNMALKQLIKHGGVPFEINNLKLSSELLEALEEGEKIIKDIKSGKRQGYHDVNKLFEDLGNEL